MKASLAWLKHQVPANPAVQPTVWPLRGPIGQKQSPSAGVDTPQLGTENFCSLAPADWILLLDGGAYFTENVLRRLQTGLTLWRPPLDFHDAPLFYYENVSVICCHFTDKNEIDEILPVVESFHSCLSTETLLKPN